MDNELKALQTAWLRYNGFRATPRQIAKLEKVGLTIEQLRRMCTDRGIQWS